jgi:hypothetical protein
VSHRWSTSAGLTGAGRAHARREPAFPLKPLINEFCVVFGAGWGPVTRRKHADDFTRFLRWLADNDIPAPTEALDFLVLARYVDDLRHRPRVHGVWRAAPDALERSLASGLVQTLSANSVNAYVRPIRSLSHWLVDEGRVWIWCSGARERANSSRRS